MVWFYFWFQGVIELGLSCEFQMLLVLLMFFLGNGYFEEQIMVQVICLIIIGQLVFFGYILYYFVVWWYFVLEVSVRLVSFLLLISSLVLFVIFFLRLEFNFVLVGLIVYRFRRVVVYRNGLYIYFLKKEKLFKSEVIWFFWYRCRELWII